VVLRSSWIIVAFGIVAIVSTVVAFAIWLISRVILALYIAIGPLLIGVALFPRHARYLNAGSARWSRA
jgi:type IV secretion system protein VirB6